MAVAEERKKNVRLVEMKRKAAAWQPIKKKVSNSFKRYLSRLHSGAAIEPPPQKKWRRLKPETNGATNRSATLCTMKNRRGNKRSAGRGGGNKNIGAPRR